MRLLHTTPMRFLSRSAFAALALLLLSFPAQAQFRAALQGTVTDQNGAAVPGATVTLTNAETGRSQTVQASGEGVYRFSGLAPGRYNVVAEQPGFNKSTVNDYVVSAEETQGLDLTLTTGALAESVTVSAGDVAQLETENADVRGSITAEEVQRLPQIGRDPYSLIRTAPGVFGTPARSGGGNASIFVPGVEQVGGASNSGVFQTENQPQVSANGQRVSSNNFLIDGVSVNSLGLGGAAVVTPNQESVKEISVVSSSYSAEDGRNTGAQVKVVSQNGTNTFHGSLFFNYGSPKLNAFNQFHGSSRFPSAPTRVELLERKFGGSLGGPIKRDRAFFFFSYEGLSRSNTGFADIFIETPEFRRYVQQVRPNSLAARLFSTEGIEPRVVSSGLTTGFAPPNGVPLTGEQGRCFDIGSINRPQGQKIGATQTFDGVCDVQFARVALPERTRGNQYNFRIDYNHSDSDQFAFSTYLTKLDNLAASRGGRPFQDLRLKPFNSAATLTWIHTLSPVMLNELRFNFTRFNDDEVESLGEANLAIPELNTNGFNFTGGPGLGLPGGGGLQYGIEARLPVVLTQNTFEGRDVLTWTRGNQTWKFGGELRHEQDNSNRKRNQRPKFFFDNFLSLANDAPFFEETLDVDPRTGGPSESAFYFRQNSYGLFAQNDWKVRPNLTLNLGLRWEYQSPLTEKNDRLSNYVFGPNGVVDGRVAAVDSLYNADRNNFAPRLGFAWSPSRLRDRAVVRGGFGISYDRHFTNLFSNVRFNPPFAAAPGGLCCGTATDPDGTGSIVYAFGSPDNPLLFPINPALRGGIDPLTGGILDPGGPFTLPGGFVRRDIPVEVNGTPENMPNAYVYNYSLEVQYELPRQFVATAGYQGSTGRKLIRTIDLNRYSPGDTFDEVRDRVQTRDALGNAVAPRLTGNPNFDRIFFPLPDVNSNYNALLLRLTRRYAQGFQTDVNYRWSKSVDTHSFGRGGQQDFPSDQSLMRGPSDFDVRHYLTVSALWDIPFFNKGDGFARAVLGGWQLNGIFTAHTGFPWTPVVFGPEQTDPNGDGILPDRPTQFFGPVIENPSSEDYINGIFPLGGPATFGVFNNCDGFPRQCFNSIVRGLPGIGRNSFRGPGFRQLDLSLVKQARLPGFLRLGEGANFEARANFFNIFNLLNLPPFFPGTDRTDVANQNFGRTPFGLAGRVVELQFRLAF